MYEDTIESKLIQATSLAENLLSKEEIDEVRLFYEKGQEWFLAYEALCFFLKKRSNNIPSDLYNLLEEISVLMELKNPEHIILKKQV